MTDRQANLEWLTRGKENLGTSHRFPRFTLSNGEGSPTIVLVSGVHAQDVLGPEVLRAMYKEGASSGSGASLVGYPFVPDPHSSTSVSPSSTRQIEQRVVDSLRSADGLVLLESPEEDMEATPYAAVPARTRFGSEGAFDQSVEMARALGTHYLIETGYEDGATLAARLSRTAARAGVPTVRIVAGQLRSATKALRAELRERLGRVLAARVGIPIEQQDAGTLGRVEEVWATEAGFVHLRARLGAEVDPSEAIAASWAFEPDLVEEFTLPGGTVLELRRHGRVDAGGLIARSFVPATTSDDHDPR